MAKNNTKTTTMPAKPAKRVGSPTGPRKMRSAVLLGHVLDYYADAKDLDVATASMTDFIAQLEKSIVAEATPRRHKA